MSDIAQAALLEGRTSHLDWDRYRQVADQAGPAIAKPPVARKALRRVSGQPGLLPPPARARRHAVRALVFLLTGLAVVHRLGCEAVHAEGAADQKRVEVTQGPFTGKLPQNVEEMREGILAATHLGEIDELKIPIAWNELVPDFGAAAGSDPIGHWKKISADGKGLEILAALADILSLPPARLATGKDPENNAMYVWPYLAEAPLDRLTPGQVVDLYRLVPPETAKLIREQKRWTWWRLSIGADGTWHSFKRLD